MSPAQEWCSTSSLLLPMYGLRMNKSIDAKALWVPGEKNAYKISISIITIIIIITVMSKKPQLQKFKVSSPRIIFQRSEIRQGLCKKKKKIVKFEKKKRKWKIK